ncbi:MAG: hypothetical protein D6675_06075 [Gemmatimonadetes bacterium]|nr:MAG: hypothetical protein D6675_06075 [Gemmatimonadota bacterium]
MKYTWLWLWIGICTSLVILPFCSVSAQDDKELPPILPTVTLPDSSGNELDLSDVVIYGDPHVRIASKKESQYVGDTFSPQAPTLIGQKDVSGMFRSDKGHQLLVQSGSERSRVIRLGFGYGNLNTLTGNLFYGDRRNNLRYFGEAVHYSSDRVGGNSDRRQQGIESGLIYLFPQGSQVTLKGAWDNHGYGLMGHDITGTDALYNHLNVDALLKIFPFTTLHLTSEAQASRTTLSHTYPDTTTDDTLAENQFRFNLGLNKIWNGRLFSFGGEWRGISLEPSQQEETLDYLFYAVQGRTYFGFEPNDYISQLGLEIGFELDGYTMNPQGTSKAMFSPYLRFIAKPYWLWGDGTIFMTVDPGLSYRTLAEMVAENPYLSPEARIVPQKRQFSYRVGGDYVLSKFRFNWGYHYIQIDDYLFWYGDRPGRWIPANGDVTEHQFTGGVDYQMNARLTVGMGVKSKTIGFRDSKQWGALVVGDSKVPYHPQLELIGKLRWTIPNEYNLELSAQYAGQQYADITGETTLGDYWLVNLQAQKQIIPHLEAHLNVINLLDETYQHWLNYEEPTAQITAGLTFQW